MATILDRVLGTSGPSDHQVRSAVVAGTLNDAVDDLVAQVQAKMRERDALPANDPGRAELQPQIDALLVAAKRLQDRALGTLKTAGLVSS